jgi:TetR/AcrR family transcriptional regulator, repressor of fatR-cypB operon
MARDRKFSTNDLFKRTMELLLQYGYEGFTFSLLADQLDVSRGTLYKYYENKEELITDFMIHEMNLFLEELKNIRKIEGFESQVDFLLELIFKNASIPPLIDIGKSIPGNINQKVRENQNKLEQQRFAMYHNLQEFIDLGRKEGKLKDNLPDSLVLGFIFQTIAIPNHFAIPRSQWVNSIKEIICHGMFVK